MKFKKIASLDEEKFRRLTGVKRPTLNKMLSILQEADKEKKARGGRKNRLSF